jgi:hypothetical protein
MPDDFSIEWTESAYRHVDLSSVSLSVADLLSMARTETVLVKSTAGDSFVISLADDFDAEVQLLRQNHNFLTSLDELKKEETIPLDEVERLLR